MLFYKPQNIISLIAVLNKKCLLSFKIGEITYNIPESITRPIRFLITARYKEYLSDEGVRQLLKFPFVQKISDNFAICKYLRQKSTLFFERGL